MCYKFTTRNLRIVQLSNDFLPLDFWQFQAIWSFLWEFLGFAEVFHTFKNYLKFQQKLNVRLIALSVLAKNRNQKPCSLCISEKNPHRLSANFSTNIAQSHIRVIELEIDIFLLYCPNFFLVISRPFLKALYNIRN